ncbi:MAG: DUF5009 domain-containing protein [Melioribacteraceae bacterium]|nr:DUF5009 domain-containing protein [Melioribacteraceae bacterium]
MILVNNPGSWEYVYDPLEHAEWNGCTPTDLIFPFFLFIVGISITFSLKKRMERGDDRRKLLGSILRRSVILFLLGLIITGFPSYELSSIRIPGVLQRIAVVYLVASIIFLKYQVKTQMIISFVILVSYWLAMTLIPTPGTGSVLLEPGANLAAWIDRQILGSHLWEYTETWDPEGILSTFPAITTTFIGIFTGALLGSDKSNTEKNLMIFVAGSIMITAGYIWDFAFPINKNMWSSSFVLYTGGIALLFYAICFWLIEISGKTKWAYAFKVFGMNAIAVYFLSEIVGKILYEILITYPDGSVTSLKEYIYSEYLMNLITPEIGSLVWAITFLSVNYIVVFILFRRRIFIKI